MQRLREHHLKNIALFFVMLLPFGLFIGNVLIEICLSGVGCAFLVRSYISRDFDWLKTAWVKAAIIFWLYITLRSIFTPDWHLSLVTAALYFRFFLFAIAVGYWVITSPQEKDKLFKAVLGVALFISFNTIIQYFFATDLFGNTVDYEKYPRLLTPRGKLVVGMMLAMILLPIVSQLLHNITTKKDKLIRLLNAAAVILFTFVIFISGERTPFIIFITGVFCIILLEKKLRRYIVHCVIIFLLLITVVYLIKPQTLQRQFGTTYMETSNFSNSSYGASFKMAWEIFKNHPIFGVGTNNFRVECQNVQVYGDRGCYLHAHNFYLEALAENGIIGFSLLIAIMLFWLKDAWVNFDFLRKDPLMLGAFLLVVLKLLPFLSGPSMHTAWAFAPFWLMLGLGYTIVWQHKEK